MIDQLLKNGRGRFMAYVSSCPPPLLYEEYSNHNNLESK